MPRLPRLRPACARALPALALALSALQVVPSPASAARKTAAAYDLTGLPPAPPVYERVMRRETERQTAASEMLQNADLAQAARTRLMVQRATSRLALGDYTGAATDLVEARKAEPNDIGLRLLLARVFWFAGRDEACNEEIRLVRKKMPNLLVARELAGLAAIVRGDWREASSEMRAAWYLAPKDRPQPYTALQAHLVEAHLWGADSSGAREPLDHVAGLKVWPAPIAEALLGRLPAEELEQLAVHPDPMVQRVWRSDLQYYLAARAAIDGRDAEAVARMQQVLACGLVSTEEYRLAQAHLARVKSLPEPATIVVEADPPAPAAVDDRWRAGDADALDREISRLVRSGAVRLAINRLREQKVESLDEERIRTLATLFLRTGQSDEGVAALRASLSGDASDAAVLATIGWTELAAALQQGVNRRTSGTERFLSAAFNPLRFKARKEGEKHLAAAREAFERARLFKPDDSGLARTNARVLEFVGQHKGALVIWRQQAAAAPEDEEPVIGTARCLLATGASAEAGALLAPILERRPNHAEARALHAEFLRKSGKRADARRQDQWAQFGAVLPPDSSLAFTPENVAALKKIEIVPREYMGIHYLEVARTRAATIEAWIADRASPDSTALLAAALWIPEPDVAKAHPIARELQQRGETALLRSILEKSQDIVAAGAAGRALAETGEAGVFPRLQDLLGMDDNPYGAGDIAGALAATRDIRAAMPLAGLLDPGFETSPRLATDEIGPVVGYTTARLRAALALASFNTDHAQGALEAGLSTPEIALHCRAALFAMTGDRLHLDAIRSALRYSRFLEMDRTFDLLERTADPELVELAGAHRKRRASGD